MHPNIQIKNLIGRCRQGWLSQGDVEKRALGPKGLHRYFLGIGKQRLQKESWPISAGKQRPRGGELKPQPARSVETNMSWGPVTSHFKNNLGRYRPGNKGEKAGGETATGQKGRNDCFPGVYKKQLERQSRSISAGKQRPKGGELKAMGPKGLHRYF